MNAENAPRNSWESWLVLIFVLCLFYGDVHFGFVFPLCMVVLPALLVLVVFKRGIAGNHHAGPALLGAVLLAIWLAVLAGGPVPVRADFGLYAPLVYAIVTAVTFSLVRISDTVLWRALLLGGLLCAANIAATMALVPDGHYTIPGQNYTETEHEYKQSKSPNRDVTKFQASPAAEVGRMDDQSVKPFYSLKNKVRSSLGRSNYLAVFFVFLFCVALFHGKHLVAIVFACMTLATMSRFGILFLIGISIAWYARSRNVAFRKLLVPTVCTLIAAIALLVFWPDLLTHVPGNQSIQARLRFWESGLLPVLDNPLFGAPRSAVLDRYQYLISWNPHNAVLWLTVLFGVWGLGCYIGYICLALRSIGRRAADSPMWRGIFVGIAAALAWSMLEIIVLTPAFEILLAMVFGISQSASAMPVEHAASAQTRQ